MTGILLLLYLLMPKHQIKPNNLAGDIQQLWTVLQPTPGDWQLLADARLAVPHLHSLPQEGLIMSIELRGSKQLWRRGNATDYLCSLPITETGSELTYMACLGRIWGEVAFLPASPAKLPWWPAGAWCGSSKDIFFFLVAVLHLIILVYSYFTKPFYLLTIVAIFERELYIYIHIYYVLFKFKV